MIQPVELELRRHHAYKSKGKGTRGCAVCNEAKAHIGHLGPPPSVNVLGSGSQFAYEALKKAWQQLLAETLDTCGLKRGLARLLVEGIAVFPDRVQRDQGNHRFVIEKALGDALVHGSPPKWAELKWARGPIAGGWLANDTWDEYEFGRLERRYEKSVAGLDLMIFPTAAGADPGLADLSEAA